MAALFARERTGGKGQKLQTSQTAATLLFQRAKLAGTVHIGKQRNDGKASGLGANFYKTADDRWLLVSPTTAKNKVDFVRSILGRPYTAGRNSTLPEELQQALRASIAEKPLADCLVSLAKMNVPAAPVNDYFDIAANQHLRDNGYIRDIAHREWGKVTTITAPTVYSGTPTDNTRTLFGPNIGEHSREILESLGFDAHEVNELLAAEAVRQGPHGPQTVLVSSKL